MYEFTINGTLNAKINDVFNAFYQPQQVIKWLAPDNMRVNTFISDFTEGGHYRAVMQSPEAFQQSIQGVYNIIEHQKKLSFTWRWDDSYEVSKVQILFGEQANKTTIIRLTQSGFKNEYTMLQEQYGWLTSLEKLSLAMRNLKLCNQTLVV